MPLQTEDEINTLKQVLASKQKEAAELKRKLGITAWKEWTTDLAQGAKNLQETPVYVPTLVPFDAHAHSRRRTLSADVFLYLFGVLLYGLLTQLIRLTVLLLLNCNHDAAAGRDHDAACLS